MACTKTKTRQHVNDVYILQNNTVKYIYIIRKENLIHESYEYKHTLVCSNNKNKVYLI